MAGDGPAVILAGVDGEESSLRAGAWAAGMARREGAKLVVVYVETTPARVTMAAAGLVVVDDGTAMMAASIREQVESGARGAGIDVEYVVRRGDPFIELKKVADERQADSVVVGASTRAGHKLVGSLAVRLVKAARWPVTVVP